MPELPQLETGPGAGGAAATSPRSGRTATGCRASRARIDTAHFSFLHAVPTKDEKDQARDLQPLGSALGDQSKPDDRMRWVTNDPRPKFASLGHDTGLVIGAARKTDTADKYWRISQFLMPNHALVPVAFPGDVYHGQCLGAGRRRQLLDLHLQLAARPAFTNSEREKFAGGFGLHAEVDDDYVPRAQHPQRLPDRPRDSRRPRASPASSA